MSEPNPTYTVQPPSAGDVAFYVKPTSNSEGLALTTLSQLFGGEWSAWRYRADSILIRTGADLTPRQVVGWTDLFSGSSCPAVIYERIGDEDEPAWAIVGGNSGVRILANDDEPFTPALGAEHLPPGWGSPVLLIEDGDDIVDSGARAALALDSGQPLYEPPDWSADDDLPPELDFDQLAEIARAWPWNVRDALGRFVATAMTDAGITNRAQRIAVIERLAVLCGDID